MTAKEFNKEVLKIMESYNLSGEKYGYCLTPTPFGVVSIRVEKSKHQKLYSLFMRFVEDFDINYFFKYFSKNEVINSHSKKWNLHNSDPNYILEELDERLNNLKYILKRDGKICGTEPKPFLEEVENRS